MNKTNQSYIKIIYIILISCALKAHAQAVLKNQDNSFESMSQTVFSDVVNKMSCQKEMIKSLNDFELQAESKTWSFKSISLPSENIHNGIARRNTALRKSFKIWSNGQISFLSATDDQMQSEKVFQFDAGKNCKMTMTQKKPRSIAVAHNIKAENQFDDSDVLKLINDNSSGLIYVWTPEMPLSYQAIKNIKSAAKLKNIPVKVLLDPKADQDQVKYLVENKLVEPLETIKLNSSEINQRDFGLHFPITFFYKNKFISNDQYVGHKETKVFTRWIDYQEYKIKKGIF